jgi:lysine 2,3-aminomutase
VAKGIEIMEALRGHTTGFCVPTYVVDAPGGGGKIPVMPSYLISSGYEKTILRNFEGVITCYNEPDGYKPSCDCEICRTGQKVMEGVAGLHYGNIALEPVGLKRNQRNKKQS